MSFRKPFQLLSGIIAILLMGQMCQAQAPASNILKNGSAEEGSDTMITGWNFNAEKLTAEDLNYRVGTEASEGKQSFHIALLKPVPANVWWAQEVALPAGAKSLQISFSAKHKTDVARTQYAVPAVSCYFMDDKNQWMQFESVQDLTESETWVTLKRNVAVPVGAARVGLRLGVQSSGVVDVFFDDVKVIASTGTYLDIVANGDLEAGTAPKIPGWTFQKKLGTDKQLAYGLFSEATGNKQSLRIAAIDTNAEVHGYWAQVLPIALGIANYQLSLRGKLGEAAKKQADATVGYAFLDEGLRPLGFQPFGLVTEKTWVDYTTVVSPPPDAKYIELRLGLEGIGQTEVFFDDIKVLPLP